MKRIVILCVFLVCSLSASAATFRVTNTNDGSWGSLGKAIEDANDHPGPDRIIFAIGSGPKTIRLDTVLPAITDPVFIDGWTQPGWVGDPLIELDGSRVTVLGFGLLVLAPSTIRGLAINSFATTALGIGMEQFDGAHGTIVHGCWIGLGLDGSSAKANGWGIVIQANDVVIGGNGPNERNVIGASVRNGVTIGMNPWDQNAVSWLGHRNRIQGNSIGVNATGTGSLPNQECGIQIVAGTDNVIGGDLPSLGNHIANSGLEAIRINDWDSYVTRTLVRHNRIGMSLTGIPMPNGFRGGGFPAIASYAPVTTVDWNVIANNTDAGVLVRPNSGTKITSNSIYNNGGLGIDLAGPADRGVTLNDPGDGDTGGNGLLNFPTITSATAQATTRIVGTYQGAANRQLAFDFYSSPACDGTGYGEGQTYLGSVNATTDAAGNASFDATVAGSAAGSYITATARDGDGSTSEFSLCRQAVGGPAITGFSPQAGRIGTQVTITGFNFNTVTSVRFFDGFANTVNASFTIVNDGRLTTIVPPGAKAGPIRLASPYAGASTGPFRVTPPAGDMNGDNKPDLIWRNYLTGESFISINDGTNHARVWLPDVLDTNWQIQGTGDFNNDGHHDIVWRHYCVGQIRIWLMNTVYYTFVDAVLQDVPDTAWHISAVGDFDGDHDPDLVWQNHVNGWTVIWIMNDAVYTGTTVDLGAYPLEARIEAAGDFDLDGRTDLLWRNYATGENYLWLMNGTSWSATIALPAVPEPTRLIEAAIDWDRDGDLDILWRNVAPFEGTNTVWLMTGTFWGGATVELLQRGDTQLRIEDY